MRSLHRLLSVAGLVLLLLLAAPPAMAHGRGSDASNFRSSITDDPQVDGVAWRIINNDEYLQVVNDSDAEVTIPGYQGEPYLRIGPDGVFRNSNSQATYINEDRFGQSVVPTNIDPEGEPDWERLSEASSYAWHDHRIHWMATADPPAVQTAPDEQHLVTTWAVPFTVGESTHEVAGELFWVPGGSAFTWLLPALLVVVLPVAWALWRTRPDADKSSWRGLSTTAGVVLLVIAVANIHHLIDDLFGTPIPLSQSAVSAVQTGFFIAIAAFGAVRAIQGREGAFTALGVGSGAIFIGQGLLYVSVLSASQTASLFPGTLTRSVIAASIVQIVPLGIAAVVGTRALLPEWDSDELAVEAAHTATPPA